MPGSTPISVPSSAPISAYSRLTAESAVPNPIARWCRISNRLRLPGPDRKLQLQPDDEYADRHDGEQDAGDERFARPEFVARRARGDDQDHRRKRDADRPYDRAEHYDAAEHDQRRPPAHRGDARPADAQRPQCEDAAEHDQQDAENAREIAGPHPRGGAEHVARAEKNRRDADRDEQRAGAEVLRTANRRHRLALVLYVAPDRGRCGAA